MKNIIYFTLSLLLFSCNANVSKNNIVNISQDVFSSEKIIHTNNFFSNIKIIRLETNKDILISGIRHIYLYNNMLFIFDKEIYVFDMNGNFLNKIGTIGNGPGEFYYTPDYAAFSNNHIFLVETNLKKVSIYTLQGEYVKSFQTNLRISQLKVLNNKLLIGYITNKCGNEYNKLVTFNMEGIKIDSLKNDMIYNDFNAVITISHDQPMFLTEKNEIGFKDIFSDTLYTIKENLSLNPIAIFNSGDLKLKGDDVYKEPDINKALRQSEKVLEILFDNKNYMILESFQTQFTCLLWDKKKNCIENVRFLYEPEIAKYFDKEKSYMQLNPKDKSSKVMIKDGTSYFKPKYVSEDNKFLIGYETSATNEDDNPIIILAEMK